MCCLMGLRINNFNLSFKNSVKSVRSVAEKAVKCSDMSAVVCEHNCVSGSSVEGPRTFAGR